MSMEWRKDVIDRAEAAMWKRHNEEEYQAVQRMYKRDKERQRRRTRSTFAVCGGLLAMFALLAWLWRIV